MTPGTADQAQPDPLALAADLPVGGDNPAETVLYNTGNQFAFKHLFGLPGQARRRASVVVERDCFYASYEGSRGTVWAMGKDLGGVLFRLGENLAAAQEDDTRFVDMESGEPLEASAEAQPDPEKALLDAFCKEGRGQTEAAKAYNVARARYMALWNVCLKVGISRERLEALHVEIGGWLPSPGDGLKAAGR